MREKQEEEDEDGGKGKEGVLGRVEEEGETSALAPSGK